MGLHYDCRDGELRFFLAAELRRDASGPRLADSLTMVSSELAIRIHNVLAGIRSWESSE
jgi:hypothetical protein